MSPLPSTFLVNLESLESNPPMSTTFSLFVCYICDANANTMIVISDSGSSYQDLALHTTINIGQSTNKVGGVKLIVLLWGNKIKKLI